MVNNIFSSNTNYKQKVKEDVEKRGIQYLVHFTSINNLPSIIEKGLISIYDLKKQEIDYDFNDTERIEGYSNSISLSVMFPNYSMFSKYRLYVEEPKDMVVIRLDPAILWEKDCAFYYNNAANKNFKGTFASLYKNFESWDSMFSEEVDERLRSNLNIPRYYTTSPQAEVLCFEPIEPKYIQEIYFQDQAMFNKYYKILPDKKNFYYLSKDIFVPRSDYLFWKKQTL